MLTMKSLHHSFNHGSALNIAVISGFICQQLNDACKAPQATLDACAQGQSAAAGATGGAAADALWVSFLSAGFTKLSYMVFPSNAAFGLQTNFATSVGTGAGTGAAAASSPTTAAATAGADTGACPAVSSAAAATVEAAPAATVAAPAAPAPASSSGLDFGSCTNPAIEFGPAFDGRKATEFSFQPENKNDINHGSALNVNQGVTFLRVFSNYNFSRSTLLLRPLVISSRTSARLLLTLWPPAPKANLPPPPPPKEVLRQMLSTLHWAFNPTLLQPLLLLVEELHPLRISLLLIHPTLVHAQTPRSPSAFSTVAQRTPSSLPTWPSKFVSNLILRSIIVFLPSASTTEVL